MAEVADAELALLADVADTEFDADMALLFEKI